MDYYLGKDVVAKDLRPVWTCWRSSTIQEFKTMAKRKSRRIYRQYIRTGDIRDFNRSQRKITRWDFD